MSVAVRQTAVTALLSTALLLGTSKLVDAIPDTVELLCKDGKSKSVPVDVEGKPGKSFDVLFDCSPNKKSFTRCYPPQIFSGVEATSLFDTSMQMITKDPSLMPGQAYAFKCFSGFAPVFQFVDFAYKMCQKSKKNREAKITVTGSDPESKVKLAFDCDGPTISKCYQNGRNKKGFEATEAGTFSTWSIFGGYSDFTIACNKWEESSIRESV